MAAAAARETKPKREPVNEIATKPPSLATKKGVSGSKVVLEANYFKLTSQTDWCLYQYRVDIAPNEERTIVRKSLLRSHKATIGAYIFDGTVLYTSHRLPENLELSSIRQEDKQAMIIKIRLVNDIVKGDYHYFQFFNIMVRKCLENLNLQLVGRNYFDAASKIEIREYKLELWPGYVTSIRQHERDVLMCTEISHKVMRNQTLLHILRDCYEKDPREYRSLFSATVIGNVVLTDYNNQTYKIDDVDYKVNPSHTFRLRDGTEISYAKYYQQKYQIRIKDLQQPLLVSRTTARERRAGLQELVYLVPELCRSTGLTDDMRNNFKLMKALSEHTRIVPSARIQRLLAFNQRLRSKPEIITDFEQWNFKLDNKLVQLPARILPAETLSFGNKTKLVTKNADWTFELQDRPMFYGQPLTDWIAFIPSKLVEQAKTFLKVVIEAGAKIKFNIAIPRIVEIPNDRIESYTRALEKITSQSNPRLILCVVPNNQLQRYAAIKKKLCVDRPIPSQVVLTKTLQGKTPSMTRAFANKIAVQLNCKMGGIPWSMPFYDILPGIMVVGFDVCHEKNADFGALVASLDVHLGRYYSAVSNHSSGEELSNDIALHLCNAVQEFRKHNQNRLPSRIVIYRDGVGEGQIPFVHSYEVEQVKKRLAMIYGGADKLNLGFIIVTKRLNSRFFLNKNNPPPGTVIDDVVTDPLKYDFFIVSQSVRQGTVAPTAYNVIEDTLGLNPDKVQMLTYKLCHMYYNYSGTVRVPAPCQYAHKLAFFTSQTIRQPAHPSLSKLLYFL